MLWLATTTAALSQPAIEEEQRLNFGTLAIASNVSVSRFNYSRTGVNSTIEGQFVLIESGSPGRYRFSGFPPNTTLDVSLNTTTLTAGANGVLEQLSVDNYDSTQVLTNGLGEAEMSLGARLSTSGSGGSYVDAPFSGTAVLRVDYWQPDVQRNVFNTSTIDLEAEHRSTLTIDEKQQLNFGTLFARTSSTSQAVLTVSPSGSYSISEPENSRLVSLVRPEKGVLKVSGAAPNYSLTVTPQVAEVLLEHTEDPARAPHFILSDLITSPDVTGTSDVNGELLVQIGGTLKTELTLLPETYPSGEYEGIYQLTVSY